MDPGSILGPILEPWVDFGSLLGSILDPAVHFGSILAPIWDPWVHFGADFKSLGAFWDLFIVLVHLGHDFGSPTIGWLFGCLFGFGQPLGGILCLFTACELRYLFHIDLRGLLCAFHLALWRRFVVLSCKVILCVIRPWRFAGTKPIANPS